MPPETKADAYQRIEAILEEGPFVPGLGRAVHRGYFLYSLRWSRVGARISEMNDLGWSITSVFLPESEWQNGIRTAYRLDSRPLQPKQDWYLARYGPRPKTQEPTSTDLPLFAGKSQ
jgi:hypothetical protein